MFSSGPNYNKLKTNLRLSVNRLKLLEKKKTETNQKARKEIAGKVQIPEVPAIVQCIKFHHSIRFPGHQQARSRKDPRGVDYSRGCKLDFDKQRPMTHPIRLIIFMTFQYLVEAMEILEMFCDLILARFGLVTQLKELDDGIAEAVSSIIWVAPRLQADVAELKVVSDMLTSKYGKPFADASRAAVHPSAVSDKLQHKMSIQAPPKLLVEKYLIEIAKIFNINYEPDQSIMQSEVRPDGFLIDLNDRNNLDGNIPAPPGPGFAAYPQPPPLPIMPHPPAFGYPVLPNKDQMPPFNYPGPGPSNNSNNNNNNNNTNNNSNSKNNKSSMEKYLLSLI